MSDLLKTVATLKRPKTLVTAAQYAKPGYARATHLPRLLETLSLPGGEACLRRLIALEAEIDDARRARNANYSAARHIEVLAALLIEAEILRDAVAFDPARVAPRATKHSIVIDPDALPGPVAFTQA